MIATRTARPARRAFTVIELMIVVVMLGLLMAILLPAIGAAREAAQVTSVKADLYSIASSLSRYGLETQNDWPMARTYCEPWLWTHSFHLPGELAEKRLLAAGDNKTTLACGLYDTFNRGHTYKYSRPGAGLHNDGVATKYVWVPDTFPADGDSDAAAGQWYDNQLRPKTAAGKVVPCPVDWVVWSVGPGFDVNVGSDRYAPLARRSWYRGFGTKGVIVAYRRNRDGTVVYSR